MKLKKTARARSGNEKLEGKINEIKVLDVNKNKFTATDYFSITTVIRWAAPIVLILRSVLLYSSALEQD